MYKHSFVICAYKESPYLEDCIKSLINQTMQSSILMVTSTPSAYIKNIANKYNISLIFNPGESGIAQDWNFAISQAETEYVTIAHQDDIYEPLYAEKIIDELEKYNHPLIAFSGYGELHNNQKINTSPLINIKRKMLFPLKAQMFSNSKFIRRRCLSVGNPICCPAVTYALNNLQKPIFKVGLKSNLDWETWERLSRLNGDFVYIPERLMYHRIHEESTTTKLISDNERGLEDYKMFKKFWPNFIAKFLTKIYSRGEKYNKV